MLLLRPAPKEADKPKSRLSIAHQVIDHHFQDEDVIGSTSFSTIDGFGKEKSKFFESDKGFIGLADSDYDAYENIIERIAIRADVKTYLSREYIGSTLFKWFEGLYKGTLPQSVGFTQYLIECSENDVKDIKIAVPISYLDIEESFKVGRVVFEFYTKEFFDDFEAAVASRNPSFEKDGLRNIRREYQGVVFASLVVCAEKERACEIATEETEKAITLLRFFSPSVFWPEIPSYLGRMGHANVPVSHSFVFEDKWPVIHSAVDEKVDYRLPIDKKHLQFLRGSGLDDGSELISKPNPTDYEKLLLNSISMFTKGVVSTDYHDKVVFCLASIETLLLKNTSEPIQHSIGLRLAFLSSLRPQQRKSVIDLVREAYEIRSSYIHHGKKRQDIDLLRNIQMTIWSVLRKCIRNRSQFQNQAQLLDFVERLILA